MENPGKEETEIRAAHWIMANFTFDNNVGFCTELASHAVHETVRLRKDAYSTELTNGSSVQFSYVALYGP